MNVIDNLKDKNVIELRNKDLYLVEVIKVAPDFFTSGDTKYILTALKENKTNDNSLIKYANDLTNRISGEYDVVKIYKDFTLKETIWERKEPLLTYTEKQYLKEVIKPFKEYITAVSKVEFDSSMKRPTTTYIRFHWQSPSDPDRLHKLCDIPVIDNKFSALKIFELYTLEDLELD